MATKMPPESSEGRVFQKFADLANKYTSGKLDVKVYPSEQLGGTEAVLEQVSAGTIHVYAEDASYLAKWVPEISYMDGSFVFADRDHWLRFAKSDLAQGWLAKAEELSGITQIGEFGKIMRGPYRVIASKRPIKTLDDLKGTKLRMYDDELAVGIWTHLGAEVRVLGWTDVYSSMQSGIIEAVTSPVALVEPMKFYEVAPNIARTNEYYQANALLVNAKAYAALPDDVRAGVIRAYNEAAEYSHQIITADDTLARMAAKGVTFMEIDRAQFVERMREFYQKKSAEGKLPAGFFEAVEAAR
jgi:TRAP-type C4-dicarboxylate transport system substrate-binding protein